MFKPALMAAGGFRHRRSVVCRSLPLLHYAIVPLLYRSPVPPVYKSMVESIQGPSFHLIRDVAAASIRHVSTVSLYLFHLAYNPYQTLCHVNNCVLYISTCMAKTG